MLMASVPPCRSLPREEAGTVGLREIGRDMLLSESQQGFLKRRVSWSGKGIDQGLGQIAARYPQEKRHGLKIKLQIQDRARTLGALNHLEKKDQGKHVIILRTNYTMHTYTLKKIEHLYFLWP